MKYRKFPTEIKRSIVEQLLSETAGPARYQKETPCSKSGKGSRKYIKNLSFYRNLLVFTKIPLDQYMIFVSTTLKNK